MDEAGVLAATMNKAEVFTDNAGELEREVRRGMLSRAAQTSANFLAAVEHDAEAEEMQTLSHHAVGFLSTILTDIPKDYSLSRGDVEGLVNGVLALRGPVKRGGSNSLDYQAALTYLFSSSDATYATIATDVFGNSFQSTYNSFSNLARRCAQAARSQDSPIETIDDLIGVGTGNPVPREALQDVPSRSEAHYAPKPPASSMASIAMAPVFPPETPKPPINNPYDFEESPVPRPRATDDDNPLAWQVDALCAQTDPEAFFPEKGGSTRDAKKVCASCDVRGECLDYALSNDERFGIWGGLSERERRKLKRRA